MLRMVLALLLMAVSPMLVAQEPGIDELRQQLEDLNRDNAALDAQNEELRKRVAELEQQTRALAPLALRAEEEQHAQQHEQSNTFSWLMALGAALVGVVAAWRLVTMRRRR